MGSFDGAKVCELESLYLLDILWREFGDNKVGLHRDGRLSCFQNLADTESEKIKKNFARSLKCMG